MNAVPKIPGYVAVMVTPTIYSYQVEYVNKPLSHGYYDVVAKKIKVTHPGSSLDIAVNSPVFSISYQVGEYLVVSVTGLPEDTTLCGRKFYINRLHTLWVEELIEDPKGKSFELMAMSDYVVDNADNRILKNRSGFLVSDLLERAIISP